MIAGQSPDEFDDADNVVELPRPPRPARKGLGAALRLPTALRWPSVLRRVGFADLVFVVGLGMLVHGLSLVAAPLPFLVVGVMFLAFGSRQPRRAR